MPFMVAPDAAPGASANAAIGKAARDVLATRVPGQAAAVNAAYATFLAEFSDAGQAAGVAVGASVAAGILGLRANDGFDNVVPYVQAPTGPGVFEPIAPTTPVDVKLQQVTPYTFGSASDFRVNPPVGLKSGEYASSFDEVKAYGGNNADTSRSQEQTDTVRFYTDQAYVQWSRTLRGIAQGRQLDLAATARLLGLVHVAAADTQVSCWWAKYHYNFWRPVHAIQRADTDGNHKTEKSASWSHLVAGNHPEYPSGHGCVTGAYTEAIESYFHTDRLPLEIQSNIFPVGDPRRFRAYDRLSDVRADVADARVWGGLHFRSTMEESTQLANRVVAHVAAHHFRETHGNG